MTHTEKVGGDEDDQQSLGSPISPAHYELHLVPLLWNHYIRCSIVFVLDSGLKGQDYLLNSLTESNVILKRLQDGKPTSH